MSKGATLITLERQRQTAVENWSPAHDSEHVGGELVDAAISYAMLETSSQEEDFAIIGQIAADCWPWEPEWFKPSDDPVKNLVRAGALIAAEIDRLLALEGGETVVTKDAYGRTQIYDPAGNHVGAQG